MAVPKKRTSKSRKNMRRAHDALSYTAVVMVCPHCGENKLMHRVCSNCGYYRGRMMFDAASADGGSAATVDTAGSDVVSPDADPASASDVDTTPHVDE